MATTTIYVTHDQIEAMTMADRIVVLRDGMIEQIGNAARDLRSSGKPVRRRVHRIACDELPVAARSPRRRDVRSCVPTALRCRCRRRERHRGSGREVRDSARASAARHRRGHPRQGFRGRADRSQITSMPISAGKEVCAITQDRLELSPDDAIRLVPALDRVRLFDPATGKVINGSR